MKEKNRRNETEVCTVVTTRGGSRALVGFTLSGVMMITLNAGAHVLPSQQKSSWCTMCPLDPSPCGLESTVEHLLRFDEETRSDHYNLGATQQTPTKCFWLGSFLQKWCFHAVDAWAWTDKHHSQLCATGRQFETAAFYSGYLFEGLITQDAFCVQYIHICFLMLALWALSFCVGEYQV